MSIPLKPLKWYRQMATKKGRREAGFFIVEGNRAIDQIIGLRPHEVIEILATAPPPPAYSHYPTRLLTESQFHAISQTRTPQGILAVVRRPANIESEALPQNAGSKILLLEDIQYPGNVGALIRTAAAFGFSGVIMSTKCADPLAPKCIQATAGSVFSVWLRRTGRYLELGESLSKSGYYLVATDLNGTEEPSVLTRPGRLLLALGNEATGLSPVVLKMADFRLRIPTLRERAESLNVAACGAICMYLNARG